MSDTNPLAGAGLDGAPAPVQPVMPFEFKLSEAMGELPVAFDLGTIPPATRVELLKSAARLYVTNRANVAFVRYTKAAAPFTEYAAAKVKYDAALAAHTADPITVPAPGEAPKAPEGTPPTPVDIAAKVAEAIASLQAGELGTKRTAEPKVKAPKDPVDKLVTSTVQNEVFQKNKAADVKYTWPQAVKEVGSSGMAYLRGRVEALVAAGGDKAALEKYMEERYLKPARIQSGVETPKNKAFEGMTGLL